MTIDYEKLINEVNQLKAQVHNLENEINFLKETWASLGYILEDTEITKEDKSEIQRIKDLVNKGDLNEFKEME